MTSGGGADYGYAINDWHWVTEPGGPIPFTFTNWLPGEPNNHSVFRFGQFLTEDYLQWQIINNSGWNDLPVTDVSQYTIVEYSTSAVPIPAALPLLAAGLGAMGFQGWRRRKALAA